MLQQFRITKHSFFTQSHAAFCAERGKKQFYTATSYTLSWKSCNFTFLLFHSLLMSKSSLLHEIRWGGKSQGSHAVEFSSYLFATNNASVGSYMYMCEYKYLSIYTYKGCHCPLKPDITTEKHFLEPLLHLPNPIHLPAVPSTSPCWWKRACPCYPLLLCRSLTSYGNREVHTLHDG